VLGNELDGLSPQDARLVEFARALTGRPWTVGPAAVEALAAAGLSRTAIRQAIGLVAMFNYLTRVADGTGIEADFGEVLPTFVYRGVKDAVERPGLAEWPAVDESLDDLGLLPDAQANWSRWRDYVLDSPEPITPTVRGQLRAIAARNACDRSVAEPGGELAAPLADFAEKLSLTPWLVDSSDVETLRDSGLDDRAILHVIAVVAYQSAESRLRIGLSALATAENVG